MEGHSLSSRIGMFNRVLGEQKSIKEAMGRQSVLSSGSLSSPDKQKPPQPQPAKKVRPYTTICAPYLSSTWRYGTPLSLQVNYSS